MSVVYKITFVRTHKCNVKSVRMSSGNVRNRPESLRYPDGSVQTTQQQRGNYPEALGRKTGGKSIHNFSISEGVSFNWINVSIYHCELVFFSLICLWLSHNATKMLINSDLPVTPTDGLYNRLSADVCKLKLKIFYMWGLLLIRADSTVMNFDS